ncbi:MAG: hypothetical protein ACYDC9_08215 [Dermatophilaceae bacterium]
MTTTTGLPVGAYTVQRGRVVYLECTRCDHVQTFPPAPGRARAVQRAVILHNRSHCIVG